MWMCSGFRNCSQPRDRCPRWCRLSANQSANKPRVNSFANSFVNSSANSFALVQVPVTSEWSPAVICFDGLLKICVQDPAMQKLLYPYLPEGMRNPQTFEWMMSNPEYRTQLEQMMEKQVSSAKQHHQKRMIGEKHESSTQKSGVAVL